MIRQIALNICGFSAHSVGRICRRRDIIIIIFAGIGIVFNVAGCLIRGRRRWSVTYTSPRGTTYFRFFLEFGIEGHFRRENLTSFLVG